MAFRNKTLVCRECGAEFAFTTGEQEFYKEKGFQNEPTRCPDCRARRRERGGSGSDYPRRMYSIVCASCGKEAQVPFLPRTGRPVYCNDCYSARFKMG